VSLVVVFPPLGLIGAQQAPVHFVVAVEDFFTVIGRVVDVLLGQLKVVLCAVIEIGRFSDHHRRHFVRDVLLAPIQSRDGCVRRQPLPLKELYDVKLLGDRALSLREHALELGAAVAAEGRHQEISGLDPARVREVPLHMRGKLLITF
jgi:hypothetical protein